MGEEKRRLLLRVILMCCMVVPFWVAQILGLSLGSWNYLIFFGPFMAGAYAGGVSRTCLSVIYVCLITASLSAVCMTAGDILRYIISDSKFVVTISGILNRFLVLPMIIGFILGLEIVGVVPILVLRELHGSASNQPVSNRKPV